MATANRWSWRFSLAPRILAVNIFALLVLAGGVFYLDSYRERLIEQRLTETRRQAELVATFLASSDPAALPALVGRFGAVTNVRLKVFAPGGGLAADSWATTGPTYRLRDPATEPFRRDIARFLDRVIEAFGSSPHLPPFEPPAVDARAAWPEAERAAAGSAAEALRRAPDRTVIISAAAPIRRADAAGPGLPVVQILTDTRDITDIVRRERLTSFLIFLGVLGASLLLSTFLANTIVRPLRRLAVAAQRVRLGRSREVTVPRFAARGDEIGQLARAVSDMTTALRNRIDATEAFAADVAHELKNPLASLRSAIDTMEAVKDPALRGQLFEVVRDDVARIDRLITDIADASRLDAELSRTRFERIDLAGLTGNLVRHYHTLGLPRGVTLAFDPGPEPVAVFGEPARLAQVLRNLIDNALSFSPGGGTVALALRRAEGIAVLTVDDQGPGIPPENRDDIFRRFYSERPEAEDFGKHSGLGLAICATIVAAHDGAIAVENRTAEGRVAGARFTVTIPLA